MAAFVVSARSKQLNLYFQYYLDYNDCFEYTFDSSGRIVERLP